MPINFMSTEKEKVSVKKKNEQDWGLDNFSGDDMKFFFCIGNARNRVWGKIKDGFRKPTAEVEYIIATITIW